MTIHLYPLIVALAGLVAYWLQWKYKSTAAGPVAMVGKMLFLAGMIAVLLQIGGPAWHP